MPYEVRWCFQLKWKTEIELQVLSEISEVSKSSFPSKDEANFKCFQVSVFDIQRRKINVKQSHWSIAGKQRKTVNYLKEKECTYTNLDF